MPDQAAPELQRIALVFGDEATVAHLREAVDGHVDIVYAALPGEFDASRLAAAHAGAALVNIDDGDWLDDIETSLNAAGVAVVFNDPEISLGLEGWERARWLRHLLAKLRGSRDVDPPRPETMPLTAPTSEAGNVVAAQEIPEAPMDDAVVERPLSPEEIETMTADFVAEPKTDPVRATRGAAAPVVEDGPPVARPLSTDTPDPDLAAGPGAVPTVVSGANVPMAAMEDAAPEAETPLANSMDADFDAEGALDVDTESLSAMIDARLAEPESQLPSDSQEVWRVVSGGATPPARHAAVDAAPTAAPSVAVPAEAAVAVARDDDADVLAGLPSLDDWQLVDPETPPAPVAGKERKAAGPSLPDTFPGLELVPMETIAPVQIRSEPIDRWMGDSKAAKPGAGPAQPARVGAAGGKP